MSEGFVTWNNFAEWLFQGAISEMSETHWTTSLRVMVTSYVRSARDYVEVVTWSNIGALWQQQQRWKTDFIRRVNHTSVNHVTPTGGLIEHPDTLNSVHACVCIFLTICPKKTATDLPPYAFFTARGLRAANTPWDWRKNWTKIRNANKSAWNAETVFATDVLERSSDHS